MSKYLIGNWKSNKNFKATYQWFDEFAAQYTPAPDTNVVVAVPFPFIMEASKKIHELDLTQVFIAAQDISPFPYGAYTGAVTAQMLEHFTNYAIIGHSERRNYFTESHLEIATKAEQLLACGITPVLCIDEPYAQKQFAAFDEATLSKVIVAYEPLSAIGTGNPADPKQVIKIVKRLQKILPDNVPIIYGGSTKPDNVTDYLNIEGISGLLPGGSSLDPQVFNQMVQKFA